MANIGFGELLLILLVGGIPLLLGACIVIWVARVLLRVQADVAVIRESLDRIVPTQGLRARGSDSGGA